MSESKPLSANNDVPAPRECLRCRREFPSRSAGNRICGPCTGALRAKAAYYPRIQRDLTKEIE